MKSNLLILLLVSISFLKPTKKDLSKTQSLNDSSITNKPQLIFVKGGDFIMGSAKEQASYSLSDELPTVHVKLDDFWIGKYEITNAQYAEFLSDKGNQIEGGASWYKLDKYALIEKVNKSSFIPKPGLANHPVSNITWYGASAYCLWLSEKTGQYYRLPTEAEWEYAARGGQKSKGYLYSGSNNAKEIAWSYEYAANSKTGWGFKQNVGTHPVGLKLPNELGIHDMSGNLKEWCLDFYQSKLIERKNPKGAEFGSVKVLRGGSWDNKVKSSRVSARNSSYQIDGFLVNKGFRVVREKEYSQLKDKLNQIATENDFNGSVLVKYQDRIIYHKSFGLSDRISNTINTNNTKYALASITKLFTSTLIMQLVSENKIDLNKSVSYYLKNYNAQVGYKITIHHLLTHTSGIENCEKKQTGNNKLPDIYRDQNSIDKIIQKYCSGSLVNEVGSKFDYNNGDYILLGKIIEEVTKKSFLEALKEKILIPLQMTNTGLITANKDVEALAQPYKWNKKANNYIRDQEILYQNYFASGAMYSTTGDLIKFSDALFNGKLINDQNLEVLLRTYPETRSYGYGLWANYRTYNKTVSKIVQRFGRIHGINTLMSHIIDEDITVITLANTNKISVSKFLNVVGDSLLD